MNGEDNYVSNTIIFDFTCRGVVLNGAATTLDGVHSWNGGGVAISINGSYDIQDRIIDCYLDYSVLEIVNPRFVLCEGNFFYNAHTELVGNKIEGLTMRDNIYSLNQYGGSRSIVLNSTDGAPTCKNMIIEGEIDGQQSGNEHIIYQTTATLELYQKNATTWTFDFSEKFLLPQIDHVSYTVVLDEGQPVVGHVARPPSKATVAIETQLNVDALVTVTAVQCNDE